MKDTQGEPNVRSLYKKVYTILGCAHGSRRSIASLDGLAVAVEEARSPSFTYFRASRRGGSEIVACSSELVKQRVDFSLTLGLVDGSGKLTKLGQEALRPERFPKIITKQTLQHLIENGVNLDAVFQSKRRVGAEFWLPTAAQVYEDASPPMKLDQFRRLLTLLTECGYLRAVQSRIYVPDGVRGPEQ